MMRCRRNRGRKSLLPYSEASLDMRDCVSRSMLSPWNCLVWYVSPRRPSQSEPDRVKGGFIMTRSWLNWGISTVASAECSPVAVTAVPLCSAIKGRTSPLDASRSRDPIEIPSFSVLPYWATMVRVPSYRSAGCDDESIEAVRWTADGSTSQAVRDSCIIWAWRLSG